MGIERFPSTLKRSSFNSNKSVVFDFKDKLYAQYFYIDFNSIIYLVFQGVLKDLNMILFNFLNGKKDIKLLEKYNLKDITEFPHFTDDDLDKIIIHKIDLYIKHMLSDYVVPESVEHLCIAIDGVPTASKLIEQKKRRYLRKTIEIYKEKLFENHEDDFEPIRLKFENMKVKWNSSKITPGTKFMNDVYLMLKSLDPKEICVNLKKYVLSGADVHSEGEMKIKRFIAEQDNKITSTVIYGSDSDIIIFTLLLYTLDKKNIKIIMENEKISVVDTNELVSKIHKKFDDFSKKNVINDIVLIFSLFGNDFIPRIMSIDIANDFDEIINLYLDFIKSHEHIVYFDKIYKINQKSFKFIMKHLCVFEKSHINNSYISSNVSNYKYLVKIFNTDLKGFTEKLSEFLDKLKKFNDGDDIEDDDFYAILNKLTFRMKNFTVENFINHYRSRNNVNIDLNFQTEDINSFFHQQNLKKPSLFKKNNYDIDVYKLENRLDNYIHKLNAHKIQFGKVKLNLDSYTLENQSFNDSMKQYYDDFFTNYDVSDIADKYIEGIIWSFEYYFNNSIDIEFANLWVYKYHKAPLLHDVCNLLNKIDLDKFDLSQYHVDRSKYINHFQQLLYVVPANVMKDLFDKKYHQFIDDFNYPDLYDIVNDVWSDKNVSHIDCLGARYLEKCEVTFLKHIDVLKFSKKVNDYVSVKIKISSDFIKTY